MKLLKSTNILNVLLEFTVIFVCFLSLYFPLKDLEPYRSEFNKLHEDYIYTFNKNYDALFENDNGIAMYHYEYGDEATLYTNRVGAELGAPVLAEAPFLAFYTFEIKDPYSLAEDTKYSLSENKIFKTREFKSKYGQVTLDVNYLVITENVANEYECEYKVYPSNNDNSIVDSLVLSDSFSARGSTIKNAVFTSQNTIGILLVLFAIIPTTALLVALSFYYSIRIDRESEQIFIDNVFYKQKKTIVARMFAKYYLKILLEIVVAGLINYFIFIGNDLSLLFIPVVIFSLIEAIYLFVFIRNKINNVLKEGVDIRYVH